MARALLTCGNETKSLCSVSGAIVGFHGHWQISYRPR